MNIYVHSSFDEGAKEEIIRGDLQLYDFVNGKMREKIPPEHYYKLNLIIKEHKGKFHRKSLKETGELGEGEYIAKAGAEKNPYNCQIKLNYFDIKRLYEKNEFFLIVVKKDNGKIRSLEDAYHYIFFHELAHVITYFNNFDKYLKWIENKGEDICEDEMTYEHRVDKVAGRLFNDWLKLSRSEGDEAIRE